METIELISQYEEKNVLTYKLNLENLELETKELKRHHKGMIEVFKDEEVKLNRLDVELENA